MPKEGSFFEQPKIFTKQEKSLTDHSFYDRVRNALKLPKPIDSALEDAERSGAFKAVDAFNNDDEQAPKLPPRDSGSRLKKLLLTSTIGLVSATHAPQIEQTGKRAAIVVEDALDEARVRANLFKDVVEDKIDSILSGDSDEISLGYAKRFGGKNFEIIEGRAVQVSREMEDGLKNFEAENGKLTPEQRKQYYKIFEAQTNKADYYQTVLLLLEIIHGNATETDTRSAERASKRLAEEITEKLTPEELKDPVRVAFEISKQRTMYAREKASLTELLNSNEGNCDALTRLLIAMVPQVADKAVYPQMAAQVFKDHVRFLVRKSGDAEWHWIDGQTHGVLTAEDTRGSVIVNVEDFIGQAIGMKKPSALSSEKKEALEKGFGYKTNSKLRWTTDDTRLPSKKFSEGEVPLRVDESKNKNTNFKQAERKKEEPEIQKIIEVSGEFSNTPQAPEEEKKTPKFLVSDADVIRSARSGVLSGDFDDISNIAGTVLTEASIYKPSNSEISELDVSVLSGSKIEKMRLNGFSKIIGVENLDVSKLKELDIALANTNVIEKVLNTSTELEEVSISVDEAMSAEERKKFLTNFDANLKSPIFEKLSKKMKGKKVSLDIRYPFENCSWYATLQSGSNGVWETDGLNKRDYLSEEVRNTIEKNKLNPKELGIFATVNNADYLWDEGVDFSKIETLVISHSFQRDDDDTSSLPEFGLRKILSESHPQTIEIYLTRDDNVEKLDLSVLAGSTIKNVIIHLEENAERPYRLIGARKLNIVYDMSEKVAQAE